MVETLDTRNMLPMMIFMDPPDHDVQRKLVSRAFTPRAIAELEPFVRATAIECLEPLVEKGGGRGPSRLGERHIGAARVATRCAPFGLPMTHEPDVGFHRGILA